MHYKVKVRNKIGDLSCDINCGDLKIAGTKRKCFSNFFFSVNVTEDDQDVPVVSDIPNLPDPTQLIKSSTLRAIK